MWPRPSVLLVLLYFSERLVKEKSVQRPEVSEHKNTNAYVHSFLLYPFCRLTHRLKPLSLYYHIKMFAP